MAMRRRSARGFAVQTAFAGQYWLDATQASRAGRNEMAHDALCGEGQDDGAQSRGHHIAMKLIPEIYSEEGRF